MYKITKFKKILLLLICQIFIFTSCIDLLNMQGDEDDEYPDNDNYVDYHIGERTCKSQGVECGVARGDNDINLDCGTCSSGKTCMANRCESTCSLGQLDTGRMSNLFSYVPIQYTDTDLSSFKHNVKTTLLPRVDVTADFPNVSRTDFRQKQIKINFGSKTLSLPLTISFKLIPRKSNVNQTIMESPSFKINQNNNAIEFFSIEDNKKILSSGSNLKTRSCNHYAFVITQSDITIYFNGRKHQISNNLSHFKGISNNLTIGKYNGKVWDLRIFDTNISQSNNAKLSESCDDQLPMQTPFSGYKKYLCGVYKCVWWPEGITDSTTENLQYQLSGQDMVWEHNVLTTGMYYHGKLCSNLATDLHPRHVQLEETYRKRWVNKYTFSNPWGKYVLHENFHAYQGRIGGGPKFLAESTANWGGYSQRPGAVDNALIGAYTLQPHYAFYATQSSPIQDGIIDFAKGGHQYGAGIFFEFITEFALNDWLVGDIYNHPDKNKPTLATYKILKQSGYDMRKIFADFAAKITTWDWPLHGPAHADREQRSYTRLFNKNNKQDNPIPDEEVDNKIAVFYGANGTGSNWKNVPRRYMVGSWAFNAYEVSVNESSTYKVGIMPASSNPNYAEFQARVVVYKKSTGKRTYHVLKVGSAGQKTTIDVEASSGEKLYLVVSSTPSTVFSEWDAYDYQYLVQKQ